MLLHRYCALLAANGRDLQDGQGLPNQRVHMLCGAVLPWFPSGLFVEKPVFEKQPHPRGGASCPTPPRLTHTPTTLYLLKSCLLPFHYMERGCELFVYNGSWGATFTLAIQLPPPPHSILRYASFFSTTACKPQRLRPAPKWRCVHSLSALQGRQKIVARSYKVKCDGLFTLLHYACSRITNACLSPLPHPAHPSKEKRITERKKAHHRSSAAAHCR